jgi:penicillin-insensitive murein DD-endopeptidase
MVFCFLVFTVPLAHSITSTCYGTPSKGRLENGIALITSGKNFTSYSTLGSQFGRTYVHSKVQDIVSKAYAQLETSAPNRVFVYGETGLIQGGKFRPHRSHQNGLSVDFMVPVVDKDGRSVPLPSNPMNKFGYGIEFDKDGNFENLSIDFEALAEHLYQLNLAAKQAGEGLNLIIFDIQYLPKLFHTKRGAYLKTSLRFMQKTPWIRHDEHYHVDFKVACGL